MLPLHADDKEFRARRGLRFTERLQGWFRLIFSDTASRNLFLFLILNLSFAFVELLYGVWTNSLGLISDSFHMFFDCTALLAGLAASVITKWRANERFSYGYVRAEVLAGFVNGLFLLFIAFFIFSEAVECNNPMLNVLNIFGEPYPAYTEEISAAVRAIEPPEVKHERLFIVSVLGFLVNLVGIFAFQHGHAHGGEGHGHSHSHGPSHSHSHGHSHNHAHGDAHSHGNGHGHSHGFGLEADCDSDKAQPAARSQIMQGVFLHILADTLGSVGVIVSAILMSQFGWLVADPICSMFIATLIGVSVLPLIRDSIYVLMQRTPKELDTVLPTCYQRVMQLEGVYSVQEPHFWTLCSDVYIGTLKLEVAKGADVSYLLSCTHSIFTQAGVKQLYVQIDYAPM